MGRELALRHVNLAEWGKGGGTVESLTRRKAENGTENYFFLDF